MITNTSTSRKMCPANVYATTSYHRRDELMPGLRPRCFAEEPLRPPASECRVWIGEAGVRFGVALRLPPEFDCRWSLAGFDRETDDPRGVFFWAFDFLLGPPGDFDFRLEFPKFTVDLECLDAFSVLEFFQPFPIFLSLFFLTGLTFVDLDPLLRDFDPPLANSCFSRTWRFSRSFFLRANRSFRDLQNPRAHEKKIKESETNAMRNTIAARTTRMMPRLFLLYVLLALGGFSSSDFNANPAIIVNKRTTPVILCKMSSLFSSYGPMRTVSSKCKVHTSCAAKNWMDVPSPIRTRPPVRINFLICSTTAAHVNRWGHRFAYQG